MKNLLGKAFILVSMLAAASTAQAYVYSFSNHTNNDMAIGMNFKGSGNMEYIVVPAHQGSAFSHKIKGEFGVRSNIGANRAGYIASRFYYIPNLIDRNGQRIAVNEKTRGNLPWKAMNIEWLPTEAYKVSLEVAEAVGNMTETVGKAALKAGAAYATGGATVAADATAEVAKNAAKKVASAKTMEELASNDYSLGKFISAIGKSVGHSMIGGNHVDIIMTDEGLKFISLLN